MQQDSIERIRGATFPIARKGYDTREVERFLSKLADWLEAGGGDQARSDVVKRELERIGEKTAGILASAEDSAGEIRADAEREAQETRARAERLPERAPAPGADPFATPSELDPSERARPAPRARPGDGPAPGGKQVRA